MAVAILSQKGGVGKSSLAKWMGYLWSEDTKPPVLIDLDPQATLTHIMGFTVPELLEKCAAHVLSGEYSRPEECVLVTNTCRKPVLLVPALSVDANLTGPANVQEYEGVVAMIENLHSFVGHFESRGYPVIIDTPAYASRTDTLPTVAAAASSVVIIPVDARMQPEQTVELTYANIVSAHRHLKDVSVPEKRAGIVLNMYSNRLRVCKEAYNTLRSRLKDLLDENPPFPAEFLGRISENREFINMVTYNCPPTGKSGKNITDAVAKVVEFARRYTWGEQE